MPTDPDPLELLSREQAIPLLGSYAALLWWVVWVLLVALGLWQPRILSPARPLWRRALGLAAPLLAVLALGAVGWQWHTQQRRAEHALYVARKQAEAAQRLAEREQPRRAYLAWYGKFRPALRATLDAEQAFRPVDCRDLPIPGLRPDALCSGTALSLPQALQAYNRTLTGTFGLWEPLEIAPQATRTFLFDSRRVNLNWQGETRPVEVSVISPDLYAPGTPAQVGQAQRAWLSAHGLRTALALNPVLPELLPP